MNASTGMTWEVNSGSEWTTSERCISCSLQDKCRYPGGAIRMEGRLLHLRKKVSRGRSGLTLDASSEKESEKVGSSSRDLAAQDLVKSLDEMSLESRDRLGSSHQRYPYTAR
jgi:hypothetical protein